MWGTRNKVNKHFWLRDQLTTRLVHVPSNRKECPSMKPVASYGRLFIENGTSLVRERSHKMLWKGKRCRSQMLMETERKNEKIEREDNHTVSLPLFFFTEQALSLLSRVTPICYLMASLLLVRFPICGQTVPLPRSAEQENVRLLAQIWGDRSCPGATKNELLLSQVWTFALKSAFDESFLWISTLLFIAGQSAGSLWLCLFFCSLHWHRSDLCGGLTFSSRAFCIGLVFKAI